jgi:hypothetical protein
VTAQIPTLKLSKDEQHLEQSMALFHTRCKTHRAYISKDKFSTGEVQNEPPLDLPIFCFSI